MQGLQNIGSTCAINSLIQIICRTTYLRDIILQEENIKDHTLTRELYDVLNMMHNKNSSLSPNKFIKYFFKHFDGIFTFGEQMDISELWIFVFNKLSNELGIEKTPPSLNNINISLERIDNLSLSKCNDLKRLCDHKVLIINEKKTSKWCDVATGILLKILQCNKCGNNIYNFEPFISIHVDIPDENKIHSLSSMFRNFLSPRTSRDDWKCDICKEKTEYTTSVKIWKLPVVLVFIINRFGNTFIKNTKPISVNSELVIKKGTVIDNMHDDMIYDCSAFGMHYGNLSGGHYCALCKTPDNQYILYDDLNLHNVNQQGMKKNYEYNKDVYMVVYTLRL